MKNSKFDKNGYIHNYFKKTVKDINFWFLASDRILKKQKIRKKLIRYLYQVPRYVKFFMKNKEFWQI